MAITKIQSESLNLADTYDFTGTVTGAGGVNTPAFLAYNSASEDLVANTNQKISFNAEVYDTDGAYDHSTNYRFTVPSGEAGKYYIKGHALFYRDTNSYDRARLYIYKNGSNTVQTYRSGNQISDNFNTLQVSQVMNLSVGDYIEIYARVFDADINISSGGNASESFFCGYKIIE